MVGGETGTWGFWPFKQPRLRAPLGRWTLTLDTYVRTAGHTSRPYTRLRLAYRSADGFRFKVRRADRLRRARGRFGTPPIALGDPDFDGAVIVKASDATRVRSLLANDKPRSLMRANVLGSGTFEAWAGRGLWKRELPAGVRELHFEEKGVIKNYKRLQALYDLFAATMDRLWRIGSASGEDSGFVR